MSRKFDQQLHAIVIHLPSTAGVYVRFPIIPLPHNCYHLWEIDPRNQQKLTLMASRIMNGGRASRESQREYPLVPRTLGERRAKLLSDAQRAAKGSSGQRLGQFLPGDEEDNRNAAIRHIQIEMAELR